MKAETVIGIVIFVAMLAFPFLLLSGLFRVATHTNHNLKALKAWFAQHSLFWKRLAFITGIWIFLVIICFYGLFEPYEYRKIESITVLKIIFGPPLLAWVIVFLWLKFWPKNPSK